MAHARSRIDWTIPGFRALLDALGVSIVDGAPKVPVHLGSDAGRVELVAVGWATVELDRAEADLRVDLVTAFEPANRDALLGASVRRSKGTEPEVLLLEPDTEGRMAGALARHGEGPIALYLRVEAHAPRPADVVTRPGTGPLGPERLVLGDSPWGPFVLLGGGSSPDNPDRVPSEP